MNNCKTCKHWQKRNEYEAGHSQGLGKCAKALMLWDCYEWRDDVDERVLKIEYEGHKSFVQDSSDYRADLLTMPDFWCVMYESL